MKPGYKNWMPRGMVHSFLFTFLGCTELRDMGYSRVEQIDTTEGRFMKKSEAARMVLSGSALLTGRK